MGGVAIHATLMYNNEILFFQYVEGAAGVDHTSYVGTWNYRTNASQPAPLRYARDVFCASNNVLPDGRVYIAGGHDHNTGKKQDAVGVAETDTYDPATRTWTPAPPLSQKRWYPTNIGLPNGTTLIFGGHARAGSPSNTVERYDPRTNTMTTLASTATKPVGLYPRMHVMPDGRVLKTGPSRQSAWFNPATSAWSNGPSMVYGSRTRGNSILLPGTSKVLAVGGQSSGSAPATGTAEILDTATGAWKATGSLTYPRLLANTVNLPDGQVLVIGGGAAFKYTNPVKVPELYNPAAGIWTPMAPQQAGRMYHGTTLLLPDGRVLSAGQDSGPLASFGEIYSPTYLFKGTRPTIASAPSTIGYGQPMAITTAAAASIAGVTMIKAGSVTHQVDTDQRAIPLTFTKGTGTLTAQSPASANLAPPGYYMLFIVDSSGVPSVAPWLRIG